MLYARLNGKTLLDIDFHC